MQLRKEAYHGQHKRGNERNGRSGHRGVEHDWSVRQRYCAERDEVEQQQQRQQDVQGRKRPGWAAVLFARARLWRTHTHRRTGGADTQGSIEKGAFWRRHVFFLPLEQERRDWQQCGLAAMAPPCYAASVHWRAACSTPRGERAGARGLAVRPAHASWLCVRAPKSRAPPFVHLMPARIFVDQACVDARDERARMRQNSASRPGSRPRRPR